MKNKLFIFLITFICAGAVSSASAAGQEVKEIKLPRHKQETGNTITVADAVQSALNNNTSVMNAGLLRDIYAAQVKQYYSYLYPSISLSGQYARNLEGPPASVLFISKNNSFSAGADANWLLFSGGTVSSGIRIAKDWRSIGFYNYQAVRNSVEQLVRNACYGVMLSSAVISIQEEYLAIAKRHLAETKAKYKQGVASNLEVTSQEVNVANIAPTVIKARNDYNIALLNLKQLLSKEAEEELFLDYSGGNIPVPQILPLEDLYKLALENRPELVIEQKNAAVAKEMVSLERANHFPTITAYGNRYYNGTTDNGFPDEKGEYYWSSAVGVRVGWSLFEGFKTSSLVKQKKLAYEQALNNYDDKVRQVKIEVNKNYLNFNEAMERLKAGEGVVEQARQNSDAFLKRFRAGLASRLELDEAALSLNTAELQYIQAVYDVFVSLANLKYSVGNEVTK